MVLCIRDVYDIAVGTHDFIRYKMSVPVFYKESADRIKKLLMVSSQA